MDGVRLPAIGGRWVCFPVVVLRKGWEAREVGFGEKKSSESGEGVDFALTKYHDY